MASNGRGTTTITAEAITGPVIHAPDITGDLTAIPDAPLLTPPEGVKLEDRAGEVVYNGTRADVSPRCIAVIGGVQFMTPHEADRLGRHLIEMAQVAADACALKGHNK